MLNTMFGDFEESLSLLEIYRDGKKKCYFIIIIKKEEEEKEEEKKQHNKKILACILQSGTTGIARAYSVSLILLSIVVGKQRSFEEAFFLCNFLREVFSLGSDNYNKYYGNRGCYTSILNSLSCWSNMDAARGVFGGFSLKES